MTSSSNLHAAAYVRRHSPSSSSRGLEHQRNAVDNKEDSSNAMLAKMRESRTTELESKIVRPLSLLDLPLDVLKEILGHLPQANDLTALASCNSTLHSLAIPSIYSRFDIVWPAYKQLWGTKAGVDALTHGLATLVKSQEIFGQVAAQQTQRRQHKSETANSFGHLYPVRTRRRGNCYAQFIRRFSINNGPFGYVRDYLISQEGGKLLGTLVALALIRMRNLEAFVWDMPTGILQDIWQALSMLGDQDEEEDHKFEKLWIRWHNNWRHGRPAVVPPFPMPNPPSGGRVGRVSSTSRIYDGLSTAAPNSTAAPSVNRVEHPSFSIVPALKSLTVLDIDELVYLDEMAILIARSAHMLKELRIGVADHASRMDWNKNWNGPEHQQVDYNTVETMASQIGHKRLQGILGIVVGRMHNLKNNGILRRTQLGTEHLARAQDELLQASSDSMVYDNSLEFLLQSPVKEPPSPADNLVSVMDGLRVTTEAVDHELVARRTSLQRETSLSQTTLVEAAAQTSPFSRLTQSHSESVLRLRPAKASLDKLIPSHPEGPFLNGTLKLKVLELERVCLSGSVLKHAFDFTTISSLTLIDCQNLEGFWKDLRLRYAPAKPFRLNKHHACVHGQLSLRKIHIDTPSYAFLRFVRETLQPNTLELLFLQDRGMASSIRISAIFTSIILRHRLSLKQLLIDSGDLKGSMMDTLFLWRRWRLTRSMLAYLTSGKMTNLRELAVNINYSDWHILLQRLVRVSTLRSLYIRHITESSRNKNVNVHDLALQMVDIIAMRPEIELCYLGLEDKCYEILEDNSSSNYYTYDFDSDEEDEEENREVPGVRSRSLERRLDDDDIEAMLAPFGDNRNLEEQRRRRRHHLDRRDARGGSVTSSSEDDDEEQGTEELFRLDRHELDHNLDETSDSDEDATLMDQDDDDEDDDSGSDGETDTGPTSSTKSAPKLKLQEILFYDKIAIFKARHGKL